MKKNKKSEFTSKVEVIAKQLKEQFMKDGNESALIILSSNKNGDVNEQNVIVMGKERQIVNSFAAAMGQLQVMKLMDEAAIIALMKKVEADIEHEHESNKNSFDDFFNNLFK